MIENAYKIKERKTGKIYSCLPQMVDINHNGNYCLRYNVGINGYNAWTFVHAIYNNDEFNEMYEVIV